MQKNFRALLIENAIWFTGSLILAIMVWIIAVSQNDPVETWRLSPRVPIRVIAPDGIIVTEQSEMTASVQLQAQRSVREAMAADDLIVRVDVRDLAPGTHIVPLEVQTVRQALVIDTSPRQITVSIEVEESQLKPVEVVIAAEPPLDYRYDDAQFSVLQAVVTGPLSLVEQVESARVSLDLTDQRTTYQGAAHLEPVDANGEVVEGVTLEPSTLDVTVAIEPRDDVKPMSVFVPIEGDLPQGYVLRSFSYDPQQVYVSGPPDVLNAIGDTLFTPPVDFSTRTGDFELTIPIQLPDPRLILIPNRNVTVTVGIEAQIVTRQLDAVPVQVIGLTADTRIQIVPDLVTVLLTGPQAALESLRATDVRVIVDVSTLSPGDSVSLTPLTTIGDGTLANVSIQVIPATIDVRMTAESTPEVTPPP